MSLISLITEQIVFAGAWSSLYKRVFPRSCLSDNFHYILHLAITAAVAVLCIRADIDFMTPIFAILVSSLANVMRSKQAVSIAVVETIFSYMIAKSLWIISAFIVSFIVGRLGIFGWVIVETTMLCALYSLLCVIVNLQITPSFGSIIVSKYSMVIISTAGVMFLLSYTIIIVPYIQQRREFNTFASLVIVALVVIVVSWMLSDIQRRKEAEEQRKHIDDLVRSAHRYKEIIPAVERELKEMQRKINAESDHDWASELGVALEEIVALRKGSDRASALELGKVPGFVSTGLALLDRQIQGEQETAAQAGILFECTVLSPATTLIESGIVTQFQLQQMVGDLYRNGEKAVRDSGEEGGRLLLILGQTEAGYQIKLCDSGIPFPKEVLDRLGERGVTTGGTGHGLADICETLADCGASLEIQAHEGGTRFRKSVSIVFDGKGEQRV